MPCNRRNTKCRPLASIWFDAIFAGFFQGDEIDGTFSGVDDFRLAKIGQA